MFPILISFCSFTETLDLHNNKLKRLPYAMHRMHALKILRVENNDLSYLPNTIARMEQLEEISYVPNPFAEPQLQEQVESLREFVKIIRGQKIPPVRLLVT